MPATRSDQKKAAGKAAASQAAPRKTAPGTTTRAKQQATNSSTSSKSTTSSSPAKTRSRTSKAPAALEKPASSDLPPPSAPKARAGRKTTKASAAPVQSGPPSATLAAPTAKNQTRKRKASTALEISAPSPPPKTKTGRRVANKAAREDSAPDAAPDSAPSPKIIDAAKEKNITENPDPGPRSGREKEQDSDSTLTSLESADFDEETRNVVEGRKPEVEAATNSAKTQDPKIPAEAAAAQSVPKPVNALENNSDATTTFTQSQKPGVKNAPVAVADMEPGSSTTATDATNLPNLTPTPKANKRAESTTLGKKYQKRAVMTSKGTKKSTLKKEIAVANVSDSTPAPRHDSSATTITPADKCLSTQAAVNPDKPMISHAAEISNAIPALTITDDMTTVHAQDPKSPLKDKSALSTSERKTVATTESQPIPATCADGDAKNASEVLQVEDSAALSNDSCSLPASAHEEAATHASDCGASDTSTALVSGGNSQLKNVLASHGTSSTAVTVSASPFSAVVYPPAPATPNAAAETGRSTPTGKEIDAPLTEASKVSDDLLLTGQSFKVLWPVYQQVREMIELKDSQHKEVIEAERKLMWQLYEQCRDLKMQLDEHEASKGE